AVFTSVAPAADGNPPYVYQWQDSLAGSGVWNDIAGATGLTYDPAAPSVQEQRFFRRRVIDNNGAGTAAFTNKVELNSTTIAQPGALSATTPACTSTSISAAGSPATGVSWYWQTSATGTETTSSYTAPFAATASGTYYLRANTGSCWSDAVSISVTILPTPANPVLQANPTGPTCDQPVQVSATTAAPAGVTYYWQSGHDPSTHTDMTSPYTGAVTVSATGNYTRYLRAHNGTCWSAGFGLVSFTINPIPAVPGALSEVNVGCEATNLQATGIPAPGVSWYWQDAENGIDRSVPYAGARAVTAGGTYYLRAEQNGCWSTASNITVTRESGTASFQVRLGRLSLPAEKQVTILNQSQVPAGSSYSWEFPGGTPASYVG
ncbi:MAG: hypothetical protein ACK5X3_24410, partial [Pseudomonadota bacterium]